MLARATDATTLAARDPHHPRSITAPGVDTVAVPRQVPSTDCRYCDGVTPVWRLKAVLKANGLA
jgi:hypothetical protein